MHLKVQRRYGREYLSVVQSYRHDGKVKTRTIETIGYADTYADRFEDPIAHFREYVDQLNRNAIAERQPIELSFGFDDEIDAQSTPTARLGAAVALGCLDALGVQSFFRARAGQPETPAHAGRIFEMLAVERMMHATSKRESWVSRNAFPRSCDFAFADVYRSLSYFARVNSALDSCISRHWQGIGEPRAADRVFLICGSYAFPVDGGSERASIAVAIDRDQMPLGYHDMPGRLEPETFREATDALKQRIGAERAVVVAGGLRNLDPTIMELASTGDGFILYQRDFRTLPELAAWADNNEEYEQMGLDVLAKSRLASRRLPDGTALPVKEVMLRGGGYATRHRHAVLVTSETDLSAAAIVQLYRELWRQAEPFQPLEADFSSMPYPTPSEDHIKAHFAICYAAFFALRMLRWKMAWQHNAAETADALLRMEGVYLQRNYYLFSYRTETTDHIEQAASVDRALRLRTKADMRSIPGLVCASFGQ